MCPGMAPWAMLTLLSYQSAGTFTPAFRVVLRRDGRTRTPGAQFWRLPFWPLNYVPMFSCNANRPRGLLSLRAASELDLLLPRSHLAGPQHGGARDDMIAILGSLL